MDKNRFHTEARGSGKTMQRSVMMMAEGNPGCMQFLVELISIGEYSKLATLAKFGISGSRHISYGMIVVIETQRRQQRCCNWLRMER